MVNRQFCQQEMACFFGQSANLILVLTKKIVFCQFALILIIQVLNIRVYTSKCTIFWSMHNLVNRGATANNIYVVNNFFLRCWTVICWLKSEYNKWSHGVLREKEVLHVRKLFSNHYLSRWESDPVVVGASSSSEELHFDAFYHKILKTRKTQNVRNKMSQKLNINFVLIRVKSGWLKLSN